MRARLWLDVFLCHPATRAKCRPYLLCIDRRGTTEEAEEYTDKAVFPSSVCIHSTLFSTTTACQEVYFVEIEDESISDTFSQLFFGSAYNIMHVEALVDRIYFHDAIGTISWLYGLPSPRTRIPGCIITLVAKYAYNLGL